MRAGARRAARLLAATVLLTLLPATGPAPAAGAFPAQPAAPPTNPVPATRIVTLITGDRVLATGPNLMIEPAEGRAGVRFLVRHVDGEQHVIPTDAMPLLHAGRLDPQLFNLTLLLAQGYDAEPDGLPLIVTSPLRTPAALPGLTVTRALPAAKAVAARLARGTGFWKGFAATRGGTAPTVWLDAKREITLDASVPLVGAPSAWQAGYDGTGVTVAVLDTGIDAAHPDLAGKVVGARNFTPQPAIDTVGHGTHVASTVAGSGAASGGRYKGVAPGVRLLDGKICINRSCPDSLIIAGMTWAAEQGADVVNLSLGGFDTPGADPVEQALNALTAQHGTLFVAAAGNDPGRPVSTPASADAALAVAATTKADGLADFSSRGPRVGDSAVKPEIAAPGVGIVAARGKDMRPVLPDRYVSFSGTSMSTPHVVGAAAILAQRHPDWTAPRLKATLTGAAHRLPGRTVAEVGAGRLDVARALRQAVTAEPGSVNYGLQRWPHTGPAVGRPVTYVNHGTAPVTLTLAATATGPNGQAVPAAAFRADPATVTVPAGGEAQVELLADSAAIGAVYGFVSGHLTATGDGVQLTTTFGLVNEEESYDLHLLHIGRDGAPAGGWNDTIVRIDKAGPTFGSGPNGVAPARLPKGVYAVYSTIGPDPDNLDTMMMQSRRVVAATDTVVVDARAARPVTITPPRAGLSWRAGTVGSQYDTPDLKHSVLLQSGSLDGMHLGRIGPNQLLPGFRTMIRGTLFEPGPDGTVTDSPAVYHLGWYVEQRVPTGFTRDVRPSDLATLQISKAVNAPGSLGITGTFPLSNHSDWGVIAPALRTRLPFHRTEYVNADGALRWFTSLTDLSLFGELVTQTLTSAPTRYAAGRTYPERWNYAVYGPRMRGRMLSEPFLTRTGNVLKVQTSMGGDSGGHFGELGENTGQLALYRNGVLIGQNARTFGSFPVPAEPADYRLEAISQRVAGAGELSTRVTSAWTFRSGHVDTVTFLPIWTVQFAPAVNDLGTAPAGVTLSVPVTAEAQPDSRAGLIRRLTVQASVDDGQTWRDVPLVRSSGGWTARVATPTGNGFVSLRAIAEDSRGNLLEQTTIRAYRYAAPS